MVGVSRIFLLLLRHPVTYYYYDVDGYGIPTDIAVLIISNSKFPIFVKFANPFVSVFAISYDQYYYLIHEYAEFSPYLPLHFGSNFVT